MGGKISLVVADDHALIRESVVALLAAQPDLEVRAHASTAGEALEQTRRHRPDVLLLELLMGRGSAFDVLLALERDSHHVAVVILTGSENHMDHLQALRLGARGVVLKRDGPEKLFEAIRTAAAGRLALSAEIAHHIASFMTRQEDTPAPGSIHRLSARERRIALLVSRGLRNRQIAAELGISENTVKRHLQSIFTKTGTHSRLQLGALAAELESKAA